MIRLFKNKFFIICLTVAVILCAVPSVFSIMGYRSLSRDIVGVITTPFRWCATAVTNAITGFDRYFTSIDVVYEENQRLKEENRQLLNNLERADVIEAENERLRDYFGMKKENPTFLFEEGTVLSYSAGNYVTGYTLNKGSLHGVSVNMAVITEEGIVGFVSEVGSTWCKVSTVIETASSVGAYIPRSGSSGIVSGDYTMSNDGFCKFSYVEADADVQVGDKIFSSGTGSVYPADLEIGEVVSVEKDEYSRTLVAKVKPSVDFSALQYMLIIKGYQQTS